ncbi:hemicentin-1-like [Mercenaria mercenaria]|uniref:hemicentin-1-like n=1 Tax=Mercenaria mercenaria TaxID=6596 RepID=UPI00234E7C90|nr:hemicentin-1-like [Mercenaria mercenaria]XP_053381214.1 hemicentin-1-like [Mercenaria mercenaria]XP_053381215.1 hemicentin-1-like [Mercenaria mercenaria]XP_053381216.1 hemicentin-1-like [Mercenaria mercenaria]XP_053381217.1 hemicentin-1-like [Mercenaria mercenaria]XP_053381218.1 hemicentin-1-like [Mercenaria mercenaria]XP_053381219.1 hemicentin-1-like [Mercenaria mercenaria]XP_053381220.1 hemicentin-1-like [Mercenaria mercenaria]
MRRNIMLTRWHYPVLVLIFVYSVTDVIYGVRFIVEPSDRVAVLDQSVLLNCQAEDDTNVVIYSWTFNSASLPVQENLIIYGNGSLLIQKVTYDDVGAYMCMAKAGETIMFSRTARLDIAYINPTFTIQPVSQKALLGDNIVLSCYIESLPPADIRWTLDGENITSGDISQEANGTSTLTLYPVMYYHVGTYKCIGTNPLTNVYRYSNDAALDVEGQPVFLSSLKSVSVPLGFQATFVCYFHGNPEPEFTWFVHHTSNGDVISNKIENSDKYMVYENGTFIINDVTEEDEAFYTCTVGNSFGDISQSALLTVTGPPTPPEFTLRPSNNTVEEGDSVTFICTCSGNPEPSSTWKKGLVDVSENGSLAISQAQSEDAGWYTCFCENDVESVSQSVYLNVYTSPVFTSLPEDVVVKAGDPVFLQCSARGNPAPSVSWLTPRFGNIITSIGGVILYQNGSLGIPSATMDDTGEYTCLASNIVGMVKATSSVTVEVAPEMTLLPLSQGVKVGSRVFLHCQASGVPDPTYSWSKDGEGVITSTPQRQIYLNNSLVIHSVTKQDEGVYRCLAGNDLGVTQAVATVTVTVPPRFTTAPRNITVQLGSSVQLQCIADGDPVPTQRWTKDDRQLVLDNNMEVTLDQSMLTITQIKETQFGKYTCTASNIAGTESVSAWLDIYDIPVFSVIPSDTVVKQSAILTLLCQGQAIEAPSVTWYKGREGEMTQVMNDIRVTVTDSGLLQIKPVEQETDEGWYTCVVGNTAGTISKEVFVDVQVPPRILSTNSPQSAPVQSQVTLTCQSVGDPVPTLQWINPSGHVISPGSTYQIMDNVLRIMSVSKEDVGNWTCKYCNLLGCDSAVVKINLEGMPAIISFTGTQDDSLVTIECTVEGNPEPSVTFTSQGQTVALPGHTVKSNRILIEVEFLNTEYRCVAGNIHGTTFRTISVPSKMDVPTVSETKPGTVTLSWKIPEDLGNLPLTGYAIQKKSDLDVTWQPVQVEGRDLLNQRSLEVPGLEAHREYTFRVAARNLLGLGEYSGQSSSVVAQSSAPSPPQNVLALEVEPGIMLIVWKKSKHLNAPKADVAYEYRIVRPAVESERGSEFIHRQGTVLYNETFQIRVDDLTEPVSYSLSIWARNIKLNLSSEPVRVVLDNTGAEYLEPEPHSGIDSFGRDKLIAIIAGSVGGIIVVILIVCVVSRIRTQRKSKSLSLLDHTLSLDQFYMENPKTLYNDDKYGSKRKSGHSFYSFDESFQSTMGSKGKHDGSVEYLGSNLSSDVLLVAKNPLYKETEIQKPVSHTSSRDKLYNENIQETACCGQSEIELPDCDITVVKGVVEYDEGQGHIEIKADKRVMKTCELDNNSEHFQEVSLNGNHDDISDIYSSMNANSLEAENADQSAEHIYTSIHSGDLQSSRKHSVQITKQPRNRADNFGSQERPLRVFSPEYVAVTMAEAKDTNSVELCEVENPCRGRSTRSASPGRTVKGSDSNEPKPPVRVLSLDLLKPSVKIDLEKDRKLKLLSESMLKEKGIPKKRLIARNGDLNDENSRFEDSTTEKGKPNGFHDSGEASDVVYSEMCNGDGSKHKKGHNVSSINPKTTTSNELKQNGETNIQNGLKGDNSLPDTNREFNPYNDNFKFKQNPKNVIDDNFLTDAEIKQEVLSAELY